MLQRYEVKDHSFGKLVVIGIFSHPFIYLFLNVGEWEPKCSGLQCQSNVILSKRLEMVKSFSVSEDNLFLRRRFLFVVFYLFTLHLFFHSTELIP